MNLHGLAIALRPPVSAGDDVVVHLLRPGKEAGQAVGYLDDGTMVVAERSRDHIGDDGEGAGGYYSATDALQGTEENQLGHSDR